MPAVFDTQLQQIQYWPLFHSIIFYHLPLNMSTPTSVDQTVQRGPLPTNEAEILALSSSPSSSPSTNQLSCSSSSPHVSSNEDSPKEASSSEPSDYSDLDYDFDSDSSDEEIPTIARSEARNKQKIAKAVAEEENDICRSDDESNNMPKGMALVADYSVAAE